MRVLITGGAGFIGSHIVDHLLSQGHQAFVVDNLSSGRRENLPREVPLHQVDVRDEQKLAGVFDEVQPQIVCHQAAQMSVSLSVRQPAFDAEVNVLGLLRVLEHSVRVGVQRIVFASSGGVLYGNVFEPADEEHPSAPISPYGISKWVGEKYLEFFAHENSLDAVALRYANVYGPRQNPHGEAGVVAIFCQQMLAGDRSNINGDGQYIRDYVYVDDVAQANVLAIEADLPRRFVALNIGTGLGTDVNVLASHLRELCQACWTNSGKSGEVPVPTHRESRPGDLRSSLICAKKAGTVLGWQPNCQLVDGLSKTVEWFGENTAETT